MTWLDERTLRIARMLREPTAGRRGYTRRLHQVDPWGMMGAHPRRTSPVCTGSLRPWPASLAAATVSGTCGVTGTGC